MKTKPTLPPRPTPNDRPNRPVKASSSKKVRTLQGKDSKKPLSPTERGIHDVALEVTNKPIDALTITFDKAMPKAKALLADGLQQLTTAVAMQGLEPVQLRELFDYSAGLEDAVKETKGFARARVLDLAIREGEKTGTGESRKLVYPDGRYTLAKAQRSGTDPKKFEAALRAKSIDVTKYMVPDIKYKMPSDYNAAVQVVDDGIFTEDEVKSMEYDVSYAVERSKEGKNE